MHLPSGTVLCAGLLLALAHSALAAPGTPAERYEAATEMVTEARYREAAAEMVAIADEHPESRLAADALFAAAQLYEEKLASPTRALELYDRLARDYPDSRTALASSRRAAILRRDLGPGGGGATPLARFTEIGQGHTKRPESESIAMMEELVEQNPKWVGLPRALLWLGRAYEQTGQLDKAKQRFLEAARAAPGTEHEFDGYRGAGRVAVAQGNFEEAERLYRAMPLGDDPARIRDFEYAIEHLDRERLRARLYIASYVILALFLIGMLLSLRLASGSWRRAGRDLARPPTEVLFMVPITLILIAASYKGHPEIRPAVAIVCFGGMVIAWLSGAGLVAARASRHAEPSRWRRLLRPSLHILACVAAVGAVCYIAVHRTRLIELVIATARFGPDV